jgi:hypothetical protein
MRAVGSTINKVAIASSTRRARRPPPRAIDPPVSRVALPSPIK